MEILMPALSPTMTEGKLTKWLIKPGDSVNAGDVIAEIETDKATMEVEVADEGRVIEIFVEEGTEGVQVNSVIAKIASDDEPHMPLRSAEEFERRDVNPSLSSLPSPVVLSSDIFSGDVGRELSREEEMPLAEEWPAGVRMREMTVREALCEAIAEEMRRSDEVFLIGEEVGEYQGAYKISQGLLQEFGARRVIDTPITEHGFTGLAVGAAMGGLKPVLEFMTFNFSMQAIDQIINSGAKLLYMSGGQMNCPIVFRGPNGSAARVGAQHSQDYASWYSHIPGLKVIQPYTAADAKGLLKSAIRDPNPVIFLENEILYGQSFMVPDLDNLIIPIGKARIARAGKDVTLVSWGIGMDFSTKAAEQLSAGGIDVELIDLRTLRPMDSDTVVQSVMKTGRLVCVDEGWPQCSVSSEVCMRVSEQAFDYLDAPPVRINSKDVPMPYAANLEKLARPSVEEVIAAIRAVTYR